MRIERDQLGILLILGALVAIFVAGLWLPHRRLVRARITQIEQHRALIDEHRNRTDDAQDTPAIGPADALRFVPDEGGLGPVLQRLSEDLVAEAVAIEQLQAESIVEGSDFNRIPITLRFEGPYDALFSVLRRIESSDRIIRVDRLEVQGTSLEFGQPLLVDMELSTFFRAAEERSP